MEECLGKICPYCKTVIEEDENIITCSDCGMPHHQECWVENRGCTTFGCPGTIQGLNQNAAQTMAEIPPQTYEEQINCFKCGFPNLASNTSCTRCGARLLKPLIKEDRAYSSNARSMLREADIIQENIDYYHYKFMKMRKENKKNSWNWSAFFFNVGWCFYRKMHKAGFIFLGAQLLIILIRIPYLIPLTIIPLGIFGNYFYMRHTEETLEKAVSVPDFQRSNYLRRKGGTSITDFFLLYCMVFIMSIFLDNTADFVTEFLSYVK